ncbi:MAG: DUF2793 domain-containing protein [Pseudomonadota bacterium]
MAEPISFPSTTANISLPLLFSGQAQKEFFLNQALATLDAVIVWSVEDTLDTPPTNTQEGHCYLVASNATGEWEGHDDQIAARIGGAWHFVPPVDGMEIFDRTLGQKLFFRAIWEAAAAHHEPTGGTVVDTEARAAIDEILNTLRKLGILANAT